ncbi:hypothetical protein VTK73DRAFT_9991 [Phialemonium thermophilum]|uniref:ER membrane protein complex subunit 7 beta-sandwich domain-containing protein n=1 Tax=Phialemonium thermophilum TaxID=223376 RepID=A0ABR3Y537_9PEZI
MHSSFLPFLIAAVCSPLALAGSQSSVGTTTITFRVPATHLLSNPYVLPPSTHATLTTFGKPPQSAYISSSRPEHGLGAFVFHNVTPGSYLVDVHCRTHSFAPVRLDVLEEDSASPSLTTRAWETYRGNDWNNKGEELVKLKGGESFELRLFGSKDYFLERSKFSLLSILRNPMILLGLVSMGIFLGMPYLVNSMDPEMRAEWEERQKSNPMNSLMGGAAGGPAGGNPIADFDMAGFLAGTSKKDERNSGKKKR